VGETIPLLLIAPFAGLASDVILHVMVMRLGTGDAPLRTQFLSVGCGALVTASVLIGFLWTSGFGALDRIAYFVLHLSIYMCFAFWLFNAISASVSSLRLRLMREFLRSSPVPLNSAALYHAYPAEELVAARIARLVSGRQIMEVDGRFYFRVSAVVFLSRCFSVLHLILMSSRPQPGNRQSVVDGVGKIRQR
jgi:hypothetical protein